MAKFLKGSDLNAQLERIFEEAERDLVILSPYIKLHPRLVDILKARKSSPDLHICIVFGKNEDNITKSVNREDFLFLREFPNIEIRYEPRLHAKYYAKEEVALLSSMNLYDFSQNNNIEFGILTKASSLFSAGDELDKHAFHYFQQVIENSDLVYHKIPVFENKLLGISKKYMDSELKVDKLSDQYDIRTTSLRTIRPTTGSLSERTGYCIRTGQKIPFNRDRPLCDEAFASWNRYKDKNYKEKFCHFSGEPSNGETSYARPILTKNWRRAKEVFGL